MPLILDCNTLVSYDRSLEYLGDFNYRNVDTLVVRGKMVNETEEVRQIWSGMDDKITGYHSIAEVILNGSSYGSGRLLNVGFPNSSDAKDRDFNFSIEFVKTGDLNIFGGANYGGIVPNDDFNFIKDLSESFTFERVGINQHEVNRTLSFSIESGFLVDNETFASSVAQQFMSNPNFDLSIIDPNLPSFYGSGNRTIQEVWDVKTQNYQFTETFRTAPQSGGYFWEKTSSINNSRDGSITASERGRILGLDPNPNFYESALSGYSGVVTGVKGRLETSITDAEIGSSGCGLGADAISKRETHDRCAGTIEYDWTFSNRWNETGCPIRSYSQTIDRTEEGYWNVSENGTLRDNCGSGTGFLISNYNEAEISGRMQALYNGLTDPNDVTCDFQTGDLYKRRKQLSVSEFNKTLSYTLEYTDSPKSNVIVTSGVTGEFLSSETKMSLSPPVHKISTFLVPNNKEIIQPQVQSEMGELRFEVALRGKKGIPLYMYLKQGFSEVWVPKGDCSHIVDSNYNFSPNRGEFNLSVTYKYTGYKDAEDVIALGAKLRRC